MTKKKPITVYVPVDMAYNSGYLTQYEMSCADLKSVTLYTYTEEEHKELMDKIDQLKDELQNWKINPFN